MLPLIGAPKSVSTGFTSGRLGVEWRNNSKSNETDKAVSVETTFDLPLRHRPRTLN